MKKFGMIIGSVILALMILIIPSQKIKADELATKSFDYNNYSEYYNTFSTQIDTLMNYLKDYDNEYYYFISFNYSSLNVYVVEKSDKVNSYLSIGSSYTFLINKSGSKLNYLNYSFTSSNFDTNFETFKTKLENSELSYDANSYSSSSNYNSSSYKYNVVLYYTNFDNYVLYSSNTHSLTINDKVYQPGEVIPTYYDYFQNQTNEFNEIISTNIYSKLEFDFTLPTIEEICTKGEYVDGVLTEVEYVCPVLDLDYNFYSSDKDGNSSGMVFGIPYFIKKYLYDTGTSTINKTDTILLGEDMSGIYQGNYIIDNDSNITGLKLVIDLTGLNYTYATLQFESNIPFEVTYYEKEVEQEYIDSVDLTGKAGVLFIPKQIDDDMLLNFSFYQNEYSIQLRDTYKDNYNILKYYSVGYCDDREYIDGIPYICNNGTGYTISVEFKKGNLEQSLFVKNRDYPADDTSIVYYDTRYFMPVVYNTMADNPTFVHPITGVEDNANSLLDFDTAMTEQKGFFEEMKMAFNRFKGVIFEILDNITYFFENMSIDLKYFYYVVLAIILFIFITRFIL